MRKWLATQKKKFDEDSNKKSYANRNWFVHKGVFQSHLKEIASYASENGLDLLVDNYSDEMSGLGFDGLSLQFNTTFTGNMVELKEANSRIFNYHRQRGAVLQITFSGTGKVQVFLDPSTSEDSKAVHKFLLVYFTSDPKNISTQMIDRWVKYLFAYQRVTGVLHQASFSDKCIVSYCKFKSFLMQYDTPDTKFKRYAGIYIPSVTLLITVLVFLLTVYTLILQLTAKS